MYTLPNDTPGKLVSLLERWQSVCRRHPPTRHDLPIEALVGEHPGMMLIEPVRSAEGLVDLMHVHVGPAHRAHTGAELEGQLYSETLDPKTFNRMIAVYRTVLETGEPHYWERINGIYGAPPVEFCRLLLPLYDPQGEAECLLGSWVWKDEELAETNSDAAVALHG